MTDDLKSSSDRAPCDLRPEDGRVHTSGQSDTSTGLTFNVGSTHRGKTTLHTLLHPSGSSLFLSTAPAWSCGCLTHGVALVVSDGHADQSFIDLIKCKL